MFRVLLRELMVTAFGLVATSVVMFWLLDVTGHRDWFDTDAHAPEVGLSADRLGARDLPLFWNAHVRDADDRTREDLADLATPARHDAAVARLVHRGTSSLPVLLPALTATPSRLSPEVQRDVFDLLARLNPGLTGGDEAPRDPAAALAYWTGFYQVRALDFRPNFAVRQATRYARTPSANAREQLNRLGTYALGALISELGEPNSVDGRARLTNVLSDITAIPLRPKANANAIEIHHISEAWKAWWFAQHLEYEQLPAWQRALAHLHETRYGHWLGRALWGRFGISAVTHRPAALELSRRLPVSVISSGLGGLFALAFVVAFGGGRALRQRPLQRRLVDLFGALIPGLGAFIGVYSVLLRLCVQHAGRDLPSKVFAQWPRLLFSTLAIGAVGALWLWRPAFRVTLQAVRVEAETWALEGRSPGVRAALRHGLRVGLASLLAPLGLAAPAVLLASVLFEPLFGVQGMGTLTLLAVAKLDAPWLMIASLSMVPVFLGQRWARRVMIWALVLESRPEDLVDRRATESIVPPSVAPSAIPPTRPSAPG